MSQKVAKPAKKKGTISLKNESLRRERGFLPYFSNTFFETARMLIRTMIPWVVILGICGGGLLLSLSHYIKTMVSPSWVLKIGISLLAALVLYWILKPGMEKWGYHMEADGLHRRFGKWEKVFSYGEISQGLGHREVKVTTRVVKVPLGRGYLRFSYEAGDKTQQKHMVDFYEQFCGKLRLKDRMPKLEKSLLSNLDRAYFYHKSFWKCILTLVFLELMVLIFNKALLEMELSAYLLNGIIVLVQYFTIWRLYQAVRFSRENAQKIRKSMENLSGIQLRLPHHHQIQFVGISLLVIAANFLILNQTYYHLFGW